MAWDTRINPVLEALSRVIYDVEAIRMIVRQADLNFAHLRLTSNVVNLWTEVLERAQDEGDARVDAVLEAALRTSDNPSLRDTIEDYWRARGRHAATQPEEVDRQAREQTQRLVREEAERQAREQAQRSARQETERDAASLQLRPPSQPIAYDDLVRSAFAELVQPGRLLFNPPDRMQLGQTERVEVRLTRTLELDAQLLDHLRGSGEPQVEEISTAPLMAVTLKGDGFRITAHSDEEQSVTQYEITTWEFDIQALKRGQQRLVMCVSLRIPVPDQPLQHKSIPVREATIDVQVGAPARIAHFVAANWQWFIGTAIAIAAVVVAALYH